MEKHVYIIFEPPDFEFVNIPIGWLIQF